MQRADSGTIIVSRTVADLVSGIGDRNSGTEVSTSFGGSGVGGSSLLWKTTSPTTDRGHRARYAPEAAPPLSRAPGRRSAGRPLHVFSTFGDAAPESPRHATASWKPF